jgi:hypothetical protein
MSRHTTLTEEDLAVILEGLLSGNTCTALAKELSVTKQKAVRIMAVKQASAMFNIFAGGSNSELDEPNKTFIRHSPMSKFEISRRVLKGWKRMSSTRSADEGRRAMLEPLEAEAPETQLSSPVPVAQEPNGKEETITATESELNRNGREMAENLGTGMPDKYKSPLPMLKPPVPEWKAKTLDLVNGLIKCLMSFRDSI